MPKLTPEEKRFLESVTAGSLVNVKTQIAQQTFSVCFTDELGRTPLHWAAATGHDLILQELLSAFRMAPNFNFKFNLVSEPWTLNGWLNLQDQNGETPLHLAVKEHHLKCVELVTSDPIATGQTKLQDLDGNTPLHIAAEIALHPKKILANAKIWQHFDSNGLVHDIENKQFQTPSMISQQQSKGLRFASQTIEKGNQIYQLYLHVDKARACGKRAIWWAFSVVAFFALIQNAFGSSTTSKPNFFPVITCKYIGARLYPGSSAGSLCLSVTKAC